MNIKPYIESFFLTIGIILATGVGLLALVAFFFTIVFLINIVMNYLPIIPIILVFGLVWWIVHDVAKNINKAVKDIHDETMPGVHHRDGYFVTVSEEGKVVSTSHDGITWTQRTYEEGD